jgi:tetratricopeptide (TPR) repeat protein
MAASSTAGGSVNLTATLYLDVKRTVADIRTLLLSLVSELPAAHARAHEALGRQAWDEAAELYDAIRQRHPKDLQAHVYGGWALREAGRSDEAEAVLSRAIALFPDDLWAHLHFALCATQTARWPDASERLTVVRTRWPDEQAGHIEGGWALREAGRLQEAEAVLDRAVERFPDASQALFHYALNAEARQDWDAACQRWSTMTARWPEDGRGREGLQRSTYMRDFRRAASSQDPAPAREPPVRSAAGPRSIVAHFESLGDSCELGFVQRHFGLEPLSLLRWASTPTDKLILALQQDFANVGSAETTYMNEYFGEEYVVSDTRYFHNIHTHVKRKGLDDEARFLEQMRRGLARLAENLREELVLCRKVFVHRSRETVSPEQLAALTTALRRHGPAKLLLVQSRSEANPSGALYWLDELTAVAHLPLTADLARETVDFDAWLQLCTEVAGRWGLQ